MSKIMYIINRNSRYNGSNRSTQKIEAVKGEENDDSSQLSFTPLCTCEASCAACLTFSPYPDDLCGIQHCYLPLLPTPSSP